MGLFGLARNISRVAGDTAASIASRSAVKSAFRHLDDAAAGIGAGDLVNREAVGGHDDVAPRPAIGQAELINQVI